ncbi:metal ABC transporter solute-binding protein, Zn/Mn family [Streptococcus canis]|uniref:metal ABC transporter solute-binding protein, Zn/Mn family n=1 Tax=Streptococcus canis TaxID=1329 RepID=UPI0012F36F4F|nr:zinc ABC transporter substrate-binding protein [Streptococcus canis]GFE43566.1 putative laminin adhesion [Streptococcus canis]
MRKNFIATITFLATSLILFVLSGCQPDSKTKTEGLHIKTSFYPIYALTKEISGDVNQVELMVKQVSIHSYEPSPHLVAKLYDGDIFIYHSKLLEAWAADLAPQLKQKGVTVLEGAAQLPLDRVQGLERVPLKKGMSADALNDPHTWTDPLLASQEADAIATLLAKKDPAHKAYYFKNAKRFKLKAEKLVERYQAKFAGLSHHTFVTQHTAFSYLAKRFGLKQLGIAGVSPEQEPNPQQLADMNRFIKRYGVKTILMEENVSDKVAKTLAKSSGVSVQQLSPLEIAPNNQKPYLDNLEMNLAILYRVLEKENE